MIKYVCNEKDRTTTAQFVDKHGNPINWRIMIRNYLMNRYKYILTCQGFWSQVEIMIEGVNPVATVKCNEKDEYSSSIGKELARAKLFGRWDSIIVQCSEKYIDYLKKELDKEKLAVQSNTMKIFFRRIGDRNHCKKILEDLAKK